MASAVDADFDEGKVVDEYFSFIYEEPTDDTFSICSDKEDLDNDNDDFSDRSEVILQSGGLDDPVYENIGFDGCNNGAKDQVIQDHKIGNELIFSDINKSDSKVTSDYDNRLVGGAIVPSSRSSPISSSSPSSSSSSWVIMESNGQNTCSDLDTFHDIDGVQSIPTESLVDDFSQNILFDDISGASTSPYHPSVSINVTPLSKGIITSPNSSSSSTSSASSSTYISGDQDSSKGPIKAVINLRSSSEHLPKSSIASAQPEVLLQDPTIGSNHNTDDFQKERSISTGPQSIYVNGSGKGEKEGVNALNSPWNSKATSVYLNGYADDHTVDHMAFSGAYPATDVHKSENVPVTIKVLQNTSTIASDETQTNLECKEKMNQAFGDFLKELPQPPIEAGGNNGALYSPVGAYAVPGPSSTVPNIAGNEIDKDIRFSGENLVCDFIQGENTQKSKLLDIGSIECDMLDELFEGMRVKNEGKNEMNSEKDIINALNDQSKNSDGSEPIDFYSLVPKSNKGNVNIYNENIISKESSLDIPSEDWKDSLVESWQYVQYPEEKFPGETSVKKIEKTVKPVAHEGVVGIEDKPITTPSHLDCGKGPLEREILYDDTCVASKLYDQLAGDCNENQQHLSAPMISKADKDHNKEIPNIPSISSSPSFNQNHTQDFPISKDTTFLPLSQHSSPQDLSHKLESHPIKPSSLSASEKSPPPTTLSLSPQNIPISQSSSSQNDSHQFPSSSLSSSPIPKLHLNPTSPKKSSSIPSPDVGDSPVFSSIPPVSLPSSLSVIDQTPLNDDSDTPSSPSSYPSSPSPLSSMQQPSLSSLPPNLFLSPASPLSFTPPSLELPELLTPNTSDYFPDTGECEKSDDYSWQEVGAVGGRDESWNSKSNSTGLDDFETSLPNETSLSYDTYLESDEEPSGSGLAAAVSSVIRRSMRRMRRLRLSGRKSPSRVTSPPPGEEAGTKNKSEETEVRRELPAEPSLGLATVRSPAAASIIVTSIVAALAPPPLRAPREHLDPPPEHTPSNNRNSDTNQTTETNGSSRRHTRRHRHQRNEGGGGGRRDDRRASLDLPLDSPLSPTAPMSLEVEIGGIAPSGYSPTAPVSLDSNTGSLGYTQPTSTGVSHSPSAPPSLDHVRPSSTDSWEAAAVIPRPILATASHNRRRSQSTPVILSSTSPPPLANSLTHSSNALSSSYTGSRENGSSLITEIGGGGNNLEPRPTHGRQQGTGQSSAGSGDVNTTPSRNATDRRRQRRRDNNSASDTNNNSNNGNNSSSTGGTPQNNNRNRNARSNDSNNNNTRQSPRRRAGFSGTSSQGLSFDSERLRVQGGTWSHNQSSLMASLAVTVTTFNISRFAVLGAKFGWPFVVQWVVISVVLGLPLMTFHVTVGQYLGAGVIDMWRISPIFQGVGYSLVIAQALVGVYCCVPIAWLFIFFRDSFITHNSMFRWADCRLVNCSINNNFSTIIIEGVPKYFSSQVLQRSDTETSWLQELGSIKFDMAVNIALIWIITLIALSKGNQSYGRVAYIVFLLPLLGYLVVCLYLASWTKDDIYINYATNFNELFKTSQSWMAASREVFLVWGFHGSVLQQMAAHNKKGHPLYRDTTVLAVITTLALVLAAVTGSSCVSGLHQNKLFYKPSSFENKETAQFLSETEFQQRLDIDHFLKTFPRMINPPIAHFLPEHYHHDNFYVGIRIRPPNFLLGENSNERSGYQSLRLGTELFPALLAVNGAQQISPFWSSLFYFSLLLFGIAQQLAVWRTVVEAVIRINREKLQSWEMCITFLCCLFGFSAALPMATGAGIHILYFLDYVMSCGWWLMIIQLVQIFALLFVRGKPYSGQDIVGELMGKSPQCRSLWLGPLTSFAWNIIVPVGLLVLSISSFKSGQFRDVFAWGNSSYWSVWARQLASALQLFPILLVPLVGLIQTCRYLTATDDDLFEKIQLLYRPSLRQRTSGSNSFASNNEDSDGEGTLNLQEGQDEEALTPRPYSDPPPKYTPPPSYSTATGVRFAKLLNHSLRLSMRRLRDTLRNSNETNVTRDSESTSPTNCSRPEESTSRINTPYIPPPDYVTVVGECRTQSQSNRVANTDPPPMYSTLDPLRRQRALAAMANATASTSNIKSIETESTQPPSSRHQRNNSTSGSSFQRSIASGVRHSARRLAATLGVGNTDDNSTLVNSEEPLSQDNHSTRDVEELHPHAYTNFEMVSQSEA